MPRYPILQVKESERWSSLAVSHPIQQMKWMAVCSGGICVTMIYLVPSLLISSTITPWHSSQILRSQPDQGRSDFDKSHMEGNLGTDWGRRVAIYLYCDKATTDIWQLKTENWKLLLRWTPGLWRQSQRLQGLHLTGSRNVSQGNIYPCYCEPEEYLSLLPSRLSWPGCTRLQLSCCHFPVMWPGVRNSCQLQQRFYLLKNF